MDYPDNLAKASLADSVLKAEGIWKYLVLRSSPSLIRSQSLTNALALLFARSTNVSLSFSLRLIPTEWPVTEMSGMELAISWLSLNKMVFIPTENDKKTFKIKWLLPYLIPNIWHIYLSKYGKLAKNT